MVAVGWLVERNEEGVGTSPRSRVQSPKWNYEGLIFENSVRSGVDIFSGSSTQVVDFPHLGAGKRRSRGGRGMPSRMRDAAWQKGRQFGSRCARMLQ